jgi:hypothetical protein
VFSSTRYNEYSFLTDNDLAPTGNTATIPMTKKHSKKRQVIWTVVIISVAVSLALFFRVRTLTAHGACTENECPPVCDPQGNCRFLPENDCCHDCCFGGWNYRVGDVYYEALGRFPECAMDGCGKCAFKLKGWGLEIPFLNRFVVLFHSNERPD